MTTSDFSPENSNIHYGTSTRRALMQSGIAAFVMFGVSWSAGSLLTTSAALTPQGILMSQTFRQDSALLAARVELFILRASIPEIAILKQEMVAIPPDAVPISTGQAAEVLAGG